MISGAIVRRRTPFSRSPAFKRRCQLSDTLMTWAPRRRERGVAHPVPLPCSETSAEPVSLAIAAFPVLAPDPTRRRLQHDDDFEAATVLRYPLSTLHERRCRHPCKTRFRLSSSAFAGRASNPPGHDERFQSTFFLLSGTCPDASWSHLRRQFVKIGRDAAPGPLRSPAKLRAHRPALRDCEGTPRPTCCPSAMPAGRRMRGLWRRLRSSGLRPSLATSRKRVRQRRHCTNALHH